MQSSKIKLLYIAGEGRSGSTLLGNILGQIDGFFFAGEPRSIWDQGILKNTHCGCGVPFNQCEIWNTILNNAFSSKFEELAKKMLTLRRERFRGRHVPMSLISNSIRKKEQKTIQTYLDNTEKLYKSIREITESRLIIDSSTYVSYAYLLKMMSSLDVRMLHLVRDSRGVAYSWTKRKQIFNTGKYMLLRRPGKAAALWIWANLISELLRKEYKNKYLRIRYEDLIKKPVDTITEILSFVKEDVHSLPFEGARKVLLAGNHGIWGNPNRFQSGIVDLKIDDEWKNKMKTIDKVWVTLISWPLLARYNYL